MNQDVFNGCAKLINYVNSEKHKDLQRSCGKQPIQLKIFVDYLSKSINQDKTPAPNNTYMQSH